VVVLQKQCNTCNALQRYTLAGTQTGNAFDKSFPIKVFSIGLPPEAF
jgi:hypothetical protein